MLDSLEIMADAPGFLLQWHKIHMGMVQQGEQSGTLLTSRIPSSVKVQCTDAGLLLLTVLLFNLSFPGNSQPWLAWIALIPMGIAVHGKRAGYAFRLALLCALLCWVLAVWWVVPGIVRVSGSSYLVAISLGLIFCIFYALPYALAASVYSRLKWTESVAGALKGALLFTALCHAIPHILPGNLAHSQYLYPRIIQIVELGGVPLLFFLMHLAAFLGVTAAVQWRRDRRHACKAAAVALLIPLLLTGYGHLRLKSFNAGSNRTFSTLKVGMVQPNVSIRARQRSDWLRESEKISHLTERLIKGSSDLDLIVWPEIPPPLSYAQQPEDRKILDRLLHLGGIPLVIAGFQRVSMLNGELDKGYYNVVEFLAPDEEAVVYRKQILLPFGEYLPYEEELPWLRQMIPHALRYLPGEGNVLFPLNGQINLMPLICYEVVFPDIVSAGMDAGANVIVNPVDDAWFGNNAAPEVHLALALFRAVEYRIPVIRASNSGRSVLIDITGEIVSGSDTELFQPAVTSGSVSVQSSPTPYHKTGRAFLWAVALFAIYFLQRDLRLRHGKE